MPCECVDLTAKCILKIKFLFQTQPKEKVREPGGVVVSVFTMPTMTAVLFFLFFFWA